MGEWVNRPITTIAASGRRDEEGLAMGDGCGYCADPPRLSGPRRSVSWNACLHDLGQVNTGCDRGFPMLMTRVEAALRIIDPFAGGLATVTR